MDKIRKNIINISPYIAWTLLFSVFYAYCASIFNDFILKQNVLSIQTLYLKGLTLFVPLYLLGYFYTNLKKFGKYISYGIIVIIVSLILSQCIIYTLVVSLPFIRRICNYLYGEKGIFDDITISAPIVMAFFYIYSTLHEQVFLQEIIIYNAFFILILMFMRNGLLKTEEYVVRRQDKSNMPAKLILDKSTKIFIITSLIASVAIIPIIDNQYKYVNVEFEILDNEVNEPFLNEEELPLEENLNENNRVSYEELDKIGKKSYTEFLFNLYAFFEPIIYFTTLIFLIIVLIKGIKAFVEILNSPLILKNDIIESTFNTDEKDIKTSLNNEFNLGEIFNFSEQMTIRRKYKRILKKHSPKQWQTPTEMEEMANLDIPKLHNDYLKVRYGSNSADI